MEQKSKQAFLVLEDGTVFEGKSAGKIGTVIGEVMFSTSMVGYQEAITSPCNHGKILVQTFPLIGNYGVSDKANESDTAHLAGYVMREICDLPSNFMSEGNLEDFLKQKDVVGICDIDTRSLTKHIRQNGEMKAMITDEMSFDEISFDEISSDEISSDEITSKDSLLSKIKSFEPDGEAKSPLPNEIREIKASAPKRKLAILDMGARKSLIAALADMGCDITVFPADSSADEILDAKPDCVLVSDGAEKSEPSFDAISQVARLMASDVPMLGISLGHQLMAMACGCSVTRLHYGHRGASQPVLDIKSGKTYITEQNHGYIVDNIDAEKCTLTYLNVNDKTCEGLQYLNTKAFSVQFLPDTADGMVSTKFIYERLFELAE